MFDLIFFLLMLWMGIMMTMDSWWGLLFIAFSIWFSWRLRQPPDIGDLP